MTAAQKRQTVADNYKIILGRNIYSMDAVMRECVYTPCKDGKYRSDCSSSIRHAYKRSDIGLPNIGGSTVGMYNNKAGKTVACAIKKGVPTDIGALRVGDILLFAGTDTSRAGSGYVGHVEMIYKIKGNVVTLCGHGSGKPSTKKMVAYCKSRQAAKTKTKRGNKGLIKVVRFIPDDGSESAPTLPQTQTNPGANPYPIPTRNLKLWCTGKDVKWLRWCLKALGYKISVGSGFGTKTRKRVKAFQRDSKLPITGVVNKATRNALLAKIDVLAAVRTGVQRGE